MEWNSLPDSLRDPARSTDRSIKRIGYRTGKKDLQLCSYGTVKIPIPTPDYLHCQIFTLHSNLTSTPIHRGYINLCVKFQCFFECAVSSQQFA